jgi:uncharacterized protein involved in response to NO
VGRSVALHGGLDEPATPRRLPFAAKGFRPFFTLAALHAVLLVPLWLAVLAGIAKPIAYLDPLSWHAHEMIFGFTVAVIAGFLLIAVGNWTQRETAVGAPLLGLAALWLAGRIAMLVPASLPRGVPAAIDLLFLPALIVVLGRPLVAAKNRRNFVLLGVLAALSSANLATHLGALGMLSASSAYRARASALDVVVLILLLIAGRVFPMFTRNATGAQQVRSHPALDIATVVGMAAVTLADAAAPDWRVAGVIAGLVGLLAAARAVHWGAWHSRREPLLWILHAGYAWVVVGLLLRAVAVYVPALPTSLATHAITIGGIGSLTLGMMTRVSLGHSGRPLATPSAMRWSFLAILGAAFARVGLPIVAPAHYLFSLVVAGACWLFAFTTFLVVYVPILVRPRLDGKPG